MPDTPQQTQARTALGEPKGSSAYTSYDIRSSFWGRSGRLSLLKVTCPFLYDAKRCDDPFSRVREEKFVGCGGDVEGRQVAVEVKGFGAVKLVHHESRQLKQRYSLATYNQMDKLSIRLINSNS